MPCLPFPQFSRRRWAATDSRTHTVDILLVVLWALGNAIATAALCNLCSFRPACLRKVASPRIASHIESVDKADGLHARYGLKSWLFDRWPFLFLNGFPVARSRPWQYNIHVGYCITRRHFGQQCSGGTDVLHRSPFHACETACTERPVAVGAAMHC